MVELTQLSVDQSLDVAFNPHVKRVDEREDL